MAIQQSSSALSRRGDAEEHGCASALVEFARSDHVDQIIISTQQDSFARTLLRGRRAEGRPGFARNLLRRPRVGA